jgi:hypothetical protein
LLNQKQTLTEQEALFFTPRTSTRGPKGAVQWWFSACVIQGGNLIDISMPGGKTSKPHFSGKGGPPKGPPSKNSLARLKRNKKAAGQMLYRDAEDETALTLTSKIEAKPKDVSYLEKRRPKTALRELMQAEEEEPVTSSYDALLQSFQFNNIEEARKAVKKRKRDGSDAPEAGIATSLPKIKKRVSTPVEPDSDGSELNLDENGDNQDSDEEDMEMDVDGEEISDSASSEDSEADMDRQDHERRMARLKKTFDEESDDEEDVEEDGKFETHFLPSGSQDVYDKQYGRSLSEADAKELEEAPTKWALIEKQALFDARVWVDTHGSQRLPSVDSTSQFQVHPKVTYSWNKMFTEILKEKVEASPQSGTHLQLSSTQQNLFSLLNSYSDVLYCLRTPLNGLEIMSTYVLHVANHLTKALERQHTSNAQIHELATQRRKIKAEIARIKDSLEKKKDEKSKKETKPSAPVLPNHVPGENRESVDGPLDVLSMSRNERYARLKELHSQLREETEFRDQGFTKPKVLVLLPMKNSALEFVELLSKSMPRGMVASVENRRKFYGDYFEEVYTSRASRPLEWLATFRGNTDDTFRLGISFKHNKSMKLYSSFYNSDIIVASPLGLRLAVDEDELGAFDYLSSLELVIVDQSDVMLMQNWDHVQWVFEHMSQLPAKTREEIDFSRVRQYFLNRQAKFFRQTIFFSSTINVDINAIFNRHCLNATGSYKIRPHNEDGSIAQVVGSASLKHVFYRLNPSSITADDDTRFEYFTNKVWEHLSGSAMEGTLIMIPSYFDYLRLVKFFKNIVQNDEINVVAVSEYTKETRGIKYRKHFYTGRAQIMLMTERYHFYKRIRIRGVKSVIWYAPPLFPHFYSEVAGYIEEGGSSLMLYSKYDFLGLEGVVGQSRSEVMVSSERTTHSISNA